MKNVFKFVVDLLIKAKIERARDLKNVSAKYIHRKIFMSEVYFACTV